VALEALACGTPVVTNNVGDVSNIIRPGETGYVIPDNSPQQIAAKIDLLLRRRNQYNHDVIRDSVSRFGWANIASMVAQECQDVILATSEGRLETAGCCSVS
jgi:glycosyltransferase involved in cell wall biosynthesis